MPYFIRFWRGDIKGMGKFNIVFLFFVAIMFAVSLVSLFGYHIYLILHNRSTLGEFTLKETKLAILLLLLKGPIIW